MDFRIPAYSAIIARGTLTSFERWHDGASILVLLSDRSIWKVAYSALYPLDIASFNARQETVVCSVDKRLSQYLHLAPALTVFHPLNVTLIHQACLAGNLTAFSSNIAEALDCVVTDSTTGRLVYNFTSLSFLILLGVPSLLANIRLDWLRMAIWSR